MNAAEIGFIAILAIVVAFFTSFAGGRSSRSKAGSKDIEDLAGRRRGADDLRVPFGMVKGRCDPGIGARADCDRFGNGVVISALSTAIAQRVASGQTTSSRIAAEL